MCYPSQRDIVIERRRENYYEVKLGHDENVLHADPSDETSRRPSAARVDTVEKLDRRFFRAVTALARTMAFRQQIDLRPPTEQSRSPGAQPRAVLQPSRNPESNGMVEVPDRLARRFELRRQLLRRSPGSDQINDLRRNSGA
jgi:hypothetical protein